MWPGRWTRRWPRSTRAGGGLPPVCRGTTPRAPAGACGGGREEGGLGGEMDQPAQPGGRSRPAPGPLRRDSPAFVPDRRPVASAAQGPPQLADPGSLYPAAGSQPEGGPGRRGRGFAASLTASGQRRRLLTPCRRYGLLRGKLGIWKAIEGPEAAGCAGLDGERGRPRLGWLPCYLGGSQHSVPSTTNLRRIGTGLEVLLSRAARETVRMRPSRRARRLSRCANRRRTGSGRRHTCALDRQARSLPTPGAGPPLPPPEQASGSERPPFCAP